MRSAKDYCTEFIANPLKDPQTERKLKVGDPQFEYYVGLCNRFNYSIPQYVMKRLLYEDEEYGKVICKAFISDSITNPVEGTPLRKGTGPYNEYIRLCKHYKYDVKDLDVEKSPRQLKIPGRSNKFDFQDGLENKLTMAKRTVQRSRGPSITEENILTVDLKQLLYAILTDERVEKLTWEMLKEIVERNAYVDQVRNTYTLHKEKGQYGLSDFILELLQNDEYALVIAILGFMDLEYNDLLYTILEDDKNAKNKMLFEKYFRYADKNTDWSFLEDALQNPYELWLIAEKMQLIKILLDVANKFRMTDVIDEVTSIWLKWREDLSEEIEEEEDERVQNRLYRLFDGIDKQIA